MEGDCYGHDATWWSSEFGKPAIVTSGHFAHNKFVVVCDADGKPLRVLSGRLDRSSAGLGEILQDSALHEGVRKGSREKESSHKSESRGPLTRPVIRIVVTPEGPAASAEPLTYPQVTLAEDYLQSGHTEKSADGLERFFARHPGLSVGRLVEVLLVDQALEWQRGAGPSVEQYLQRFPIVSDQRQAVLELACGEMRAARTLGLPVDVDLYVVRFPDLAESLRRQMEVSAWLADDGNDTKIEDRPPR